MNVAVSLLARQEMTVLAGGTDLYPATTAQSLAAPVLDVTAIEQLRGISQADGWLRLGAAGTWTDIVSADLPPTFDALKAAAREVGGVQIQNRATIGGNLCNASPAADGVPPLLVLDAEVELTSRTGIRRLPLADFVTGNRQTRRRADELLTAIWVPPPALSGRSGFAKLGARRYLIISIVMVAVRLAARDGQITDAAVAVGACGPVAARQPEIEARLAGWPLDREPVLADAALRLSPIDDARASAAYRLDAARVLVRDTVERVAVELAGSGPS